METWLDSVKAHPIICFVVGVAAYRILKARLKEPQLSDQPLHRWVKNTDFDESFIHDTLIWLPSFLQNAWSELYFGLWKLRKGFPEPLKTSADWKTRIDENILLAALPYGEQRLREMQEEGVTMVVNLCHEYDGDRNGRLAAVRIQQLRVPVVDHLAPTLVQCRCVVEAMQAHLQSNASNQILVHCKSGKGRSTTALLCYYVKAARMTPLQAITMIARKRPCVSARVWKRQVVKQFTEETLLAPTH